MLSVIDGVSSETLEDAMKMFDKDRAVSAVLSVLLLALVTFCVGIFLYNFVMNSVRNLVETPSTQPFTLLIENVNINDTCITVYIRNSCKKNVAIKGVYVNDEPCNVLPSDNKVIQKNSVEEVHISGSYTKGVLYEIKIICTSGYTLLSTQRY